MGKSLNENTFLTLLDLTNRAKEKKVLVKGLLKDIVLYDAGSKTDYKVDITIGFLLEKVPCCNQSDITITECPNLEEISKNLYEEWRGYYGKQFCKTIPILATCKNCKTKYNGKLGLIMVKDVFSSFSVSGGACG